MLKKELKFWTKLELKSVVIRKKIRNNKYLVLKHKKGLKISINNV